MAGFDDGKKDGNMSSHQAEEFEEKPLIISKDEFINLFGESDSDDNCAFEFHGFEKEEPTGDSSEEDDSPTIRRSSRGASSSVVAPTDSSNPYRKQYLSYRKNETLSVKASKRQLPTYPQTISMPDALPKPIESKKLSIASKAAKSLLTKACKTNRVKKNLSSPPHTLKNFADNIRRPRRKAKSTFNADFVYEPLKGVKRKLKDITSNPLKADIKQDENDDHEDCNKSKKMKVELQTDLIKVEEQTFSPIQTTLECNNDATTERIQEPVVSESTPVVSESTPVKSDNVSPVLKKKARIKLATVTTETLSPITGKKKVKIKNISPSKLLQPSPYKKAVCADLTTENALSEEEDLNTELSQEEPNKCANKTLQELKLPEHISLEENKIISENTDSISHTADIKNSSDDKQPSLTDKEVNEEKQSSNTGSRKGENRCIQHEYLRLKAIKYKGETRFINTDYRLVTFCGECENCMKTENCGKCSHCRSSDCHSLRLLPCWKRRCSVPIVGEIVNNVKRKRDSRKKQPREKRPIGEKEIADTENINKELDKSNKSDEKVEISFVDDNSISSKLLNNSHPEIIEFKVKNKKRNSSKKTSEQLNSSIEVFTGLSNQSPIKPKLRSTMNELIKQKDTSEPVLPRVEHSIDKYVKLPWPKDYNEDAAWQYGHHHCFTSSVDYELKKSCFLCGSAGDSKMYICSCCCESFHAFCLDMEPLDELNWCCDRCKRCSVCGLKENLLMCDKCHDCYHAECLGPFYQRDTVGAEETWVCGKCVKCVKCDRRTAGRSKNSKWSCNFSMCEDCGYNWKRGNYCPICTKLYQEDDDSLKMMYCSNCEKWIHMECEGISLDDYEILAELPENIPYVCKLCFGDNKSNALWYREVKEEMNTRFLKVYYDLISNRTFKMLKKGLTDNLAIVNSLQAFDVVFVSLENKEYACVRDMYNVIMSALYNLCARLKEVSLYDSSILLSPDGDSLSSFFKQVILNMFPWFSPDKEVVNEDKENLQPVVPEEFPDGCSLDIADNHSLQDHTYFQRTKEKSKAITDRITNATEDERYCMFCSEVGDQDECGAGRLLYSGANEWVHVNCALWSAEVYEDQEGRLKHVHDAFKRGSKLKCEQCDRWGATVGCCIMKCTKSYHFNCAKKSNVVFLDDKKIYCTSHNSKANKNLILAEDELCVKRRVLVDLTRFKSLKRIQRGLDPATISITCGSMSLQELGSLNEKCDVKKALIPVGYKIKRIFWSTKNPYERCTYTCEVNVDIDIPQVIDTITNEITNEEEPCENNNNKTYCHDELEWSEKQKKCCCENIESSIKKGVKRKIGFEQHCEACRYLQKYDYLSHNQFQSLWKKFGKIDMQNLNKHDHNFYSKENEQSDLLNENTETLHNLSKQSIETKKSNIYHKENKSDKTEKVKIDGVVRTDFNLLHQQEELFKSMLAKSLCNTGNKKPTSSVETTYMSSSGTANTSSIATANVTSAGETKMYSVGEAKLSSVIADDMTSVLAANMIFETANTSSVGAANSTSGEASNMTSVEAVNLTSVKANVTPIGVANMSSSSTETADGSDGELGQSSRFDLLSPTTTMPVLHPVKTISVAQSSMNNKDEYTKNKVTGDCAVSSNYISSNTVTSAASLTPPTNIANITLPFSITPPPQRSSSLSPEINNILMSPKNLPKISQPIQKLSPLQMLTALQRFGPPVLTPSYARQPVLGIESSSHSLVNTNLTTVGFRTGNPATNIVSVKAPLRRKSSSDVENSNDILQRSNTCQKTSKQNKPLPSLTVSLNPAQKQHMHNHVQKQYNHASVFSNKAPKLHDLQKNKHKNTMKTPITNAVAVNKAYHVSGKSIFNLCNLNCGIKQPHIHRGILNQQNVTSLPVASSNITTSPLPNNRIVRQPVKFVTVKNTYDSAVNPPSCISNYVKRSPKLLYPTLTSLVENAESKVVTCVSDSTNVIKLQTLIPTTGAAVNNCRQPSPLTLLSQQDVNNDCMTTAKCIPQVSSPSKNIPIAHNKGTFSLPGGAKKSVKVSPKTDKGSCIKQDILLKATDLMNIAPKQATCIPHINLSHAYTTVSHNSTLTISLPQAAIPFMSTMQPKHITGGILGPGGAMFVQKIPLCPQPASSIVVKSNSLNQSVPSVLTDSWNSLIASTKRIPNFPSSASPKNIAVSHPANQKNIGVSRSNHIDPFVSKEMTDYFTRLKEKVKEISIAEMQQLNVKVKNQTYIQPNGQIVNRKDEHEMIFRKLREYLYKNPNVIKVVGEMSPKKTSIANIPVVNLSTSGNSSDLVCYSAQLPENLWSELIQAGIAQNDIQEILRETKQKHQIQLNNFNHVNNLNNTTPLSNDLLQNVNLHNMKHTNPLSNDSLQNLNLPGVSYQLHGQTSFPSSMSRSHEMATIHRRREESFGADSTKEKKQRPGPKPQSPSYIQAVYDRLKEQYGARNGFKQALNGINSSLADNTDSRLPTSIGATFNPHAMEAWKNYLETVKSKTQMKPKRKYKRRIKNATVEENINTEKSNQEHLKVNKNNKTDENTMVNHSKPAGPVMHKRKKKVSSNTPNNTLRETHTYDLDMLDHDIAVDNFVQSTIEINSSDTTRGALKKSTRPVKQQQQKETKTRKQKRDYCGMMLRMLNDEEETKNKMTQTSLKLTIKSDDGWSVEGASIEELWRQLLNDINTLRVNTKMKPLHFDVSDAYDFLGVSREFMCYLIEQLPGGHKCRQYKFQHHLPCLREDNQEKGNSQDFDIKNQTLVPNPHGCARLEAAVSNAEKDMFAWLASPYRLPPEREYYFNEEECFGSGQDLPVAMKYRLLRSTSRDHVGVFRSKIQGRGLFCKKPIEAGEMIIEYSGEKIRAALTDRREEYYEKKGIGCYMFRIDDMDVVDATMKGNAARFINHSCDPNCFSKIISVDGCKKIVIFALNRIHVGEELTYDYKFAPENDKLPCFCGSKKCRKYLN